MADPVELQIEGRPHDLGGFSVRRLLPEKRRRNVGPVIFFDHLGPAVFEPGEGVDVRSHPHIGLSTITWLFEGALDHRDSLGTFQTIRPGEVNWMTSGCGITHSERTPAPEREAGHTLHAIQLWAALPKSHERQAPAFDHHPAHTLPVLDAGGVTCTVIAGSYGAARSPVEFPSDIRILALTSAAGGLFRTPEAAEIAVYVAAGSARIGDIQLHEGVLAVLAPDTACTLEMGPGCLAMVVGGAALDGRRNMEWNFVASRPAMIAKAKEDWRASIAAGFKGSHFTLPNGEVSWIPLPGDPQPEPHDTPPTT